MQGGENADTYIEHMQCELSSLRASLFNAFERQVQSADAQMAAVIQQRRSHRTSEPICEHRSD